MKVYSTDPVMSNQSWAKINHNNPGGVALSANGELYRSGHCG